jgi:hypothetical protein
LAITRDAARAYLASTPVAAERAAVAAVDERADVVAWLRNLEAVNSDWANSNCIERGEHVGAAERERAKKGGA